MKNRQFYIFLFSIIALIGIQQYLINNMLTAQKADGTVINYAGRQRMLSQNIAKNVLNIENKELQNLSATEERRILRELLLEFEKAHNGLISRDEALKLGGKNSEQIQKMFDDLQPSFNVINVNSQKLLQSQQIKDVQTYASVILNNEQTFLKQMDNIVFQYDKEYSTKVGFSSFSSLILTVFTIAIFFFEAIYIILPLIKKRMSSDQ